MNRKARRADNSQRGKKPPAVLLAELFATAMKHVQAGQPEAAITCFRKAVRIAPEFAGAHYNLGNALAAQDQTEAAIDCFRNAIERAPGLAEAHCNLGAALRKQARLAVAEQSCRQAIALSPGFALAHFNLGTVLEQQRRLDEAVGCYRMAIGLQPGFAEAHLNLAMSLLALGDMQTGWREYEWRWQTPQMRREFRSFAQPQWHGEPAAGRTLLIHAEQGFGDTLQFCRYATLAAARGFRVILEVPGPLLRLLRTLPGIDRVVEPGQPLPAFDLHAPMLSLPLAFATERETIPANTPYLVADTAEIAIWQHRVASLSGESPRIGLVWAGNSRKDRQALVEVDQRRSIALEQLAPIFEIPQLQFFSLQKDARAPNTLPLAELIAEGADFADTAALIATLDLVISVDTSVAHLAGALGKPVWLLNRFDADWRWLTARRDSPWYPTMRIYSQTQPSDWDSVIAELTTDLRGFAAHRARSVG